MEDPSRVRSSSAATSETAPKPRPASARADLHLADVPFLLEKGTTRTRNALGVSFVSHVIVIALAIYVAQRLPAASADLLRDLRNYDIVWLPIPGPGGGGGGGGNKMPEPPRKAEIPGKDKTSVPVVEPPTLQPPETTKDEPKPEQELTIPAKTLASAEQTLPGVLEGAPVPTTSQGAGTGGGGGTGTGTGIGPGQGSGLGPGWGGGAGGGAFRPGSGIELPRVLREVKPQYTPDAMRAKVQGTVLLECIVQTDGTVGEVQVIRSLDPTFGLDQEAVKAAKQWRFVPGTRFGQAVPVIVTIELTFTLR